MTGTINVIMAAIRAQGETVIECAAVEPEVVDFCHYLTRMGVKMEGIGTSTLKIFGNMPLHGCEYTVIGDRMEAGTFVCAGLITGSSIRILGLEVGLLDTVLDQLKKINADVFQDQDGVIHVRSADKLISANIITGPHPGFPTDLQAQFCSLLTQSYGESTVMEKVYLDRFFHIPELNKMGAEISLIGPCVQIKGPRSLEGAHLRVTDLRAGAALYLAGLCAKGDTFIHDIYHLNRGYENFAEKLKSLGAVIECC
jgi:UDP-N-acetylglucosamine 1-carboxyvinyltransferase